MKRGEKRPRTRPIGVPFQTRSGRWYIVQESNGRVAPYKKMDRDRVCIICKQTKPASAFYVRTSKRTGEKFPESRCNVCARARSRNRRKDNPRVLWLEAGYVAKRRGLAFTLTEEEYTALRSQSCHYCQGPLPPTSVALDRIDTSVGYVTGNVLPCCDICNTSRYDFFTVDEMLIIGAAIREARAMVDPATTPRPPRGRPRID